MAGWRWVAASLTGALLSALLVLALPRPRPLPATPTIAEWPQLVSGLTPPAQVSALPAGWQLHRQSASACDVALDAQLQPMPPAAQQRDLSCLAWRDDALQLLAKRWPAWSQVRAGTELSPASALDRLLLVVAALLAGALLPLGLALLCRMDRKQRLAVLLVFGLALLLRLVWPWRWTAVYFAYEWLDQARYLDSVPRYGPGALVPWAWLLGPAGESPQLVHAVQLVLGSLGVAAWTGAVLRATGRLGSALWVGVPLAATPVILRNDVSESMHVPALTALGLAAWATVEARQRPTWLAAVTLAAGLSYAVLCRADLLPTALLAVLAVAWLAAPVAPSLPQRRWLWLPLLPATLVLAAVAWMARERALADELAGNLPQVHRFADEFFRHLAHDAVLWRPDWWPLAAWLPLLAAVIWLPGRERRAWRWLALLAVAVASLLPSWLDYNETSLPRLQAPAQVLATVALGALGELTLVPRPRWRWAVWALWLVSAGVTLPANLRRTAAHDEADLIAQLVASAPAPGWLAVRSYADEPAQGLHLHWPTWWLRSVGLVPVPMGQVRRSLDAGAQPLRPLYALRSVRCYALPLGEPVTLPSHEQPDCRQLATSGRMLPLWANGLYNHGDTATFNWYGADPTLRVGLYQWPRPNPLGMQPDPR